LLLLYPHRQLNVKMHSIELVELNYCGEEASPIYKIAFNKLLDMV
jgi:hypothetical protein